MTLSGSRASCPREAAEVGLFDSFKKRRKNATSKAVNNSNSLVASNSLASLHFQDDNDSEVFLSFSDCFMYFVFEQ